MHCANALVMLCVALVGVFHQTEAQRLARQRRTIINVFPVRAFEKFMHPELRAAVQPVSIAPPLLSTSMPVTEPLPVVTTATSLQDIEPQNVTMEPDSSPDNSTSATSSRRRRTIINIGLPEKNMMAFPISSLFSRAHEKASPVHPIPLHGGVSQPLNANHFMIPTSLLTSHNLSTGSHHQMGMPAVSLADLLASGTLYFHNNTLFRNESGLLRPFGYVISGFSRGAGTLKNGTMYVAGQAAQFFISNSSSVQTDRSAVAGSSSVLSKAGHVVGTIFSPVTGLLHMKYKLARGIVTAPVTMYRFIRGSPTDDTFNATAAVVVTETMANV